MYHTGHEAPAWEYLTAFHPICDLGTMLNHRIRAVRSDCKVSGPFYLLDSKDYPQVSASDLRDLWWARNCRVPLPTVSDPKGSKHYFSLYSSSKGQGKASVVKAVRELYVSIKGCFNIWQFSAQLPFTKVMVKEEKKPFLFLHLRRLNIIKWNLTQCSVIPHISIPKSLAQTQWLEFACSSAGSFHFGGALPV